jgi:hypothetical protein
MLTFTVRKIRQGVMGTPALRRLGLRGVTNVYRKGVNAARRPTGQGFGRVSSPRSSAEKILSARPKDVQAG